VTVNTGNTKSMFIIPYLAENNKEEWEEKIMITGTIEGLFTQTDGDWNALVVMNGHSKGMVSSYLSDLKGKYYPKIDIWTELCLQESLGILSSCEQ
jgi:hypothetical protein